MAGRNGIKINRRGTLVLVLAVAAGGLIRVGVLFKKLLQNWAAPTASCPRSLALTDLSHPYGSFDPDEVHQFSFGNVKAQANMVVWFHCFSFLTWHFMTDGVRRENFTGKKMSRKSILAADKN